MRRPPLLLVVAAWAVVGPAAAADHAVDVRDNVFDPATVTIAPGDSVTWTNRGLARHSVTGNGFSRELLPLQSYTQAFAQPGRYPYRCTFHESTMRGTVIVRAATATTSSTTTTTASRTTSTLAPDGSAVTAPGETTTTTQDESTTTTEETTTTTADLAGLAAGTDDAGGDDTATGAAAALAAVLLLGVSGGTLFALRKGVIA